MLGDQKSSGSSRVAYLFSDRHSVFLPGMHQREKALLMPHLYHAASHSRPGYDLLQGDGRQADRDWTARNEPWWTGHALVAAVLCRSKKVDPLAFQAWTQLSIRTASTLAMFAKPADASRWLRAEALSRGNGLMRTFEHAATSAYIHRLQAADLNLDPRVWNGEATTLDAYWQSLPMLSMSGQHMSNRFGLASTGALGLVDHGTNVLSLKEVEDVAVRMLIDDSIYIGSLSDSARI